MNDRLSFYRKKNSPIHALNPFTKLVLALALIVYGLSGKGLWTATLMVGLVLLPLVLASKLLREYLGVAVRLILPTAAFMFVMQSIFIPGGTTEIFRLGFISVELETVQRSYLIASRIFLFVSAFVLLLLTTHPSELMSDLTRRGLPPQFAYVIISTLQIIPQMQAKAQTIIAAQRSRGLDTESSFFKRVGLLVPLAGPLVFGSLVEVEERAIAIEARGFTSTRPKTFLRDIPDTPADKIIRWALVIFILLSLAARLWQS
ncbi:MAG: energy-coupling factor transporter transmembrane component T [Anaerolineales bacterium]